MIKEDLIIDSLINVKAPSGLIDYFENNTDGAIKLKDFILQLKNDNKLGYIDFLMKNLHNDIKSSFTLF